MPPKVKSTEAQIEAFFQSMEDTDWSADSNLLDEFAKDLGYIGFDAKYLRQKIMDALIASNMNDDEKKRIVKACIFMAVERGNKISKMLKSMSGSGAALVGKAKSTFGFVESVGANRKEALTLARFALCFPIATLNYMVHSNRPAVTIGKMASISTSYPAQLCHSAFSAVIPSTLSQVAIEQLIQAHVLFQLEFSKVINGGKFTADTAAAEQAMVFITNGMNSQLVEEIDRLNFCYSKSLISSADSSASVTAVIASAAKKAQALYNLNSP